MESKIIKFYQIMNFLICYNICKIESFQIQIPKLLLKYLNCHYFHFGKKFICLEINNS